MTIKTFNVDEKDYEEFLIRSIRLGTSVSARIQEFIKDELKYRKIKKEVKKSGDNKTK